MDPPAPEAESVSMSLSEPQPQPQPEQSDDHLIDSYRPFIADVPRSAWAEPFPVPEGDVRSDQEVREARRRLRRKISSTNFDPPIPLSDFCLIAQERWNREDGDGACDAGECLIL
jgi:hypothetical protein